MRDRWRSRKDDLVCPPHFHFDIFEKRFTELGGKLEVVPRNLWGHHPHGFDDPAKVVDFLEHNVNEARDRGEL